MRLFRNLLFVVIALVLVLIGYNVTRHFIYWSPTEELSIESDGVTLAATLIKPDESGRFPVMLLLHGSGPEVRGDPANRAVINALRRHGVASLTYDKRGTGASTGDFESALYRDFITDALAVLDHLASRSDIDSDRIGLYTVSESGWFGPEIAVRNGNVDLLFGKVSCPLSWEDTVSWEVRNDFLADGIAEGDVPALVDLVRKRWAYYRDAAADPSLASGPRRDALNAEAARLRETVPGAADALSPALLDYDAELYREIAADVSYDTRPWLAETTIPQYYAYAGLDINMPTNQCVAYLETLRRETGRDITVKVYPQAGHSLLHWTGIFSQGFVPGYLEELTNWVSRHFGTQ